jgi:hypothetical protein
MVAKVCARALQVFIGEDAQDWSAHYESLTIGDNALDESGLIKITGELVIRDAVSVPESVDPRENPSRWRPGVPVRFKVRNDANSAWIDPRFAYCTVLAESDPKKPLTLQVGCTLAWKDTANFDGDESAVLYGNAENCDLVAARLLQASGIDAGDISLSTWPYALAYPVGKEGNRSFLSQAGQLAWSNDGRLVYQNASGTITQKTLDFTPAVAIVTVAKGANDPISWEPLRDPQAPAETTKVAAVGYELEDLDYSDPIIDEETDDLSNYAPTLSGRGVVSRITATITVDAGDPGASPDPIPPTHHTNIETRQLEAIIFQVPTIPGQLLLFEESDVEKTYESGLTDPSKAKLVNVVETLQRREKAMVPDGVFSNMRTIFEKTINITYDTDESILSIAEVTEEAEIIYDPDSENPWIMRVTNSLTTSWEKIGSNRWIKVEESAIAKIAEDSNADKYAQNIWALKKRSRRYPASRNNAPPSVDFFDAEYSEEEIHYSGTATHAHRGGPTGRTKEQLFVLPYGFSDSQCSGMATKYRDLMIGRNLGEGGPLELSDALLQSPPLPEIHVVEDGTTYKYLADSLSFEFTQGSAKAYCAGIWIAGGYS